MATYVELYTFRSDATLLQRISTALIIAANTVRLETANTPNHSNRVSWAQQVIRDPDTFSQRTLSLLLATNKDATVAQIQGVSDATIQTAVDSLVNLLTGLN